MNNTLKNLEMTLVDWNETLELEKNSVELLKEVFEKTKKDFMLKSDLLEIYERATDRVEDTEKRISQIEADIERQKIAPVDYKEMKKILTELNKEWNVDFVSATQGNDMGELKTKKATEQWEQADTEVIVGHWSSGCNYRGKLEEQDSFYIYYKLFTTDENNVETEVVSVEKVCKDLAEALQGRYTVTVPESSMYGIRIERVVA